VYLTVDTVVPYLLQRGVLSSQDIVCDEWFVLMSDPKRPVFRVSTPAGLGWIVKQPSPLDLTRVRMLDREATVYDLAVKDKWARPWRALVPSLRAYDPGVHVLVAQLLAYDTGWDHLRRASVKADVLGRLMARAYAATHVVVPRTGVPTTLFAPQLPWILQLERTDSSDAEDAGMQVLLDVIRDEPALGQALVRLVSDWRVETLIHGDAKLDNVLVRMNRQPKVWLIDWAFAAEGDPAWDIGCVIRSCLLLWLFGIEFRRDEPFGEAASRSVFPLALVRSFATAFLLTYVRSRSFTQRAAQEFVRRAFRYAGAAMIQSALADARARERFTLRQLAMLQMSSHILESPDTAYRELLYEA
jgi:hypothetical protein